MRRHTESAPHAPPADSASVGTSISNPCFNCHLLARWSVAQLAIPSDMLLKHWTLVKKASSQVSIRLVLEMPILPMCLEIVIAI